MLALQPSLLNWDELSIMRVLSFPLALHAVTNSCSHLKDKLSPCLSENDFALIVSGRSGVFFHDSASEGGVMRSQRLRQRYARIVPICVYVMIAIEVMPHKVHDNPTRLRE